MSGRASSVLATCMAAVALGGAVAAIGIEVMWADSEFVVFYLAMAGFAVAGGVVAAKRPANPVGWLLAGYGITAVVAQGAARYASVGSAAGLPDFGVAGWLAAWLWALGLPLLGVALLRFPDGHPLSPRWRLPEVAAALAVAGMGGIAILLWPFRHLAAGWDDPSNWVGPAARLWAVVAVFVFVPLLSGAAAMVVRYRRSGGLVRAQIRWVVYPVGIVAVGVIGFMLTGAPGHGAHPLAEAIVLTGMIGTPSAIAVAVLRYRLYEIDRLISRTVSYALVTGVLVTVYAGGVLTLGRVLAPLTRESELAVAASILLVAAAFGPVRRAVQSAVDRRFNRARYDAQRTVEIFAARLRDEVDLDELSEELAEVVQRTVAPASVSLWVREAAG